MKLKNIAVIATSSKTNEIGGAEKFYQGLTNALNNQGVQADLISEGSDEKDFDSIKISYLKFYDLDLSMYDGVISTKAPSYIIRHKNHICYLVHTMRVFYDMFETEFQCPGPELHEQRTFIQNLDALAFQKGRIKKIFTIGHEVTNRLLKYLGIESEVLHPALMVDHFRPGGYDDYILLPGRLHRWKRVELIIEAMKYIDHALRLIIIGKGEDEKRYQEMAQNDSRINFLGFVTDDDLVHYYSNALVVPFVPIKEDYGYITLEAFKSEKPVITCRDSGEPAYLVTNNYNGFICDPVPEQIAEKIHVFIKNKDKAKEYGRNGRVAIENIAWSNIARKLIAELQKNNGC